MNGRLTKDRTDDGQNDREAGCVTAVEFTTVENVGLAESIHRFAVMREGEHTGHIGWVGHPTGAEIFRKAQVAELVDGQVPTGSCMHPPDHYSRHQEQQAPCKRPPPFLIVNLRSHHAPASDFLPITPCRTAHLSSQPRR